ncbi:hypothetical protein AKJ65_01230 [candidate division MSBL1 archaeon SCGC-AAA259E19]|uniref:HEPN domain-containing protein n=1 Tax=candidate division MSBL1 archaeon SCGC-AAA259E19 TaxID=1698264 RepID=A0A133UND9_9EURY|nr:hypothetical protein AKJ65_01230 [candidate division MSBL1 archaeon SCGC-AAA259E19]
MNKEKQAAAYLREARLTLKSARTIYESSASGEGMWAQVVKNAYDAMEQAASAGIAHREQRIPRSHTAKIKRFVELYDPEEELSESIFHWLGMRSDSQYVDIRGDKIVVPHELFNQEDAAKILKDA